MIFNQDYLPPLFPFFSSPPPSLSFHNTHPLPLYLSVPLTLFQYHDLLLLYISVPSTHLPSIFPCLYPPPLYLSTPPSTPPLSLHTPPTYPLSLYPSLPIISTSSLLFDLSTPHPAPFLSIIILSKNIIKDTKLHPLLPKSGFL